MNAELTTAPWRARAIAFYLPQFHPTPQNDEWWGKGFTEWRNVVRNKPLVKGHEQPHLAGELGYYDLRVPETRAAQAELARAHGIAGFCYYHYWFHGKRLLERPFNRVLASGEPNFPFCLCWANESWGRVWDGRADEYLMEQKYSDEDDIAHLRWLARAFQDTRYLRVQGKPLFLVYRARALANPQRSTALWRAEAQRLGLGELFLCRVESNFADERGDPRALGFDAAVEFQPDVFQLGAPKRRGKFWDLARRRGWSAWAYINDHYWAYGDVVQRMLQKPIPAYPYFPGITPRFDNTPRRKREAHILQGATPALYEKWLRAIVARLETRAPDERLVFINAWNEWAEGAHLEPDARYGRQFLEATRRALQA